MKKVTYATNKIESSKEEVETNQIAMEIIELVLVLYARSEKLIKTKSIPFITRVPQLLKKIADEKKLAIDQLGGSNSDVLFALNSQMKEIYFTTMDLYMFERTEKEIAWLLLRGTPTSECVLELHISKSQFHYKVQNMMKKTKTGSKGEMVVRIRRDAEKS